MGVVVLADDGEIEAVDLGAVVGDATVVVTAQDSEGEPVTPNVDVALLGSLDGDHWYTVLPLTTFSAIRLTGRPHFAHARVVVRETGPAPAALQVTLASAEIPVDDDA